MGELETIAPPPSSITSSSGTSSNALVRSARGALTAFSDRRSALGLSNPGTVENIAKEVQRDVLLSSHMFTGLRADISNTLGLSPMFQTSHAFSIGAQGLPPWTFLTIYGTPSTFLQGTLDSDGLVGGRANYRWTDGLVTRAQGQVASGSGQAMMQFETDYTGQDCSASIKAINPSMLHGGLTGIMMGSFLQSVTPGLALGLEAMWQRQAVETGPDTAMSYVARYKGDDWIASANFQSHGALSTTFYRRLTKQLEVGTDLTLQFQPGLGAARGGLMGLGAQREGTATVGVKYDFRMSTYRAQVDSTGKISAWLEKRILPFVTLSFASELDWPKQSTKLGLGLSIEHASQSVQEQQNRNQIDGISLPQPPY